LDEENKRDPKPGDKVYRIKANAGNLENMHINLLLETDEGFGYMTTSEIEYVCDIKVNNVKANGTFESELILSEFKIWEGTRGYLRFDSSREKHRKNRVEPGIDYYMQIMGKGLPFRFSNNGNLNALPLYEKVFNDSMQSGKRKNLFQAFKSSMNRILESYFMLYPEEPIGLGSTWRFTKEKEVELGRLIWDVTYSYTKIMGVQGEIAMQGKLSGRLNGISENANIQGDISGVMKVDTATGWTNSGEVLTEFIIPVPSGKVGFRATLTID